MLGLSEMAEYWPNFDVPDAIGQAAPLPESEGEDSVDWLSVLDMRINNPGYVFRSLSISNPEFSGLGMSIVSSAGLNIYPSIEDFMFHIAPMWRETSIPTSMSSLKTKRCA